MKRTPLTQLEGPVSFFLAMAQLVMWAIICSAFIWLPALLYLAYRHFAH